MKCPFHCGFKGNPFEVDEHQIYLCPKRTILCPNEGCKAEGIAKEIEEEHFPACPFLRAYCSVCQLPTLVGDLRSHDCVGALKEGMQSMGLLFLI